MSDSCVGFEPEHQPLQPVNMSHYCQLTDSNHLNLRWCSLEFMSQQGQILSDISSKLDVLQQDVVEHTVSIVMCAVTGAFCDAHLSPLCYEYRLLCISAVQNRC